MQDPLYVTANEAVSVNTSGIGLVVVDLSNPSAIKLAPFTFRVQQQSGYDLWISSIYKTGEINWSRGVVSDSGVV